MMCEEMIFEYWFSTIRKLSARKKYLLRELIGTGKKIYYIEETEIAGIEPIGTDREGNEVNLYDIIESTETDIPERIHLKDNIQKLYEKLENELSPREKLVLKMRYGLYQGEEYTQREIAAQLGISRSYVSRIEKSAIGKLRQYF